MPLESPFPASVKSTNRTLLLTEGVGRSWAGFVGLSAAGQAVEEERKIIGKSGEVKSARREWQREEKRKEEKKKRKRKGQYNNVFYFGQPRCLKFYILFI